MCVCVWGGGGGGKSRLGSVSSHDVDKMDFFRCVSFAEFILFFTGTTSCLVSNCS